MKAHVKWPMEDQHTTVLLRVVVKRFLLTTKKFEHITKEHPKPALHQVCLRAKLLDCQATFRSKKDMRDHVIFMRNGGHVNPVEARGSGSRHRRSRGAASHSGERLMLRKQLTRSTTILRKASICITST